METNQVYWFIIKKIFRLSRTLRFSYIVGKVTNLTPSFSKMIIYLWEVNLMMFQTLWSMIFHFLKMNGLEVSCKLIILVVKIFSFLKKRLFISLCKETFSILIIQYMLFIALNSQSIRNMIFLIKIAVKLTLELVSLSKDNVI